MIAWRIHFTLIIFTVFFQTSFEISTANDFKSGLERIIKGNADVMDCLEKWWNQMSVNVASIGNIDVLFIWCYILFPK